MRVLNDKAHDTSKLFYTDEEQVKSERGMGRRERERERKVQECVR